MIKKTLGEVLDEFPSYKLQAALVVVRHIKAHRIKESREGRIVFSLPMSFFTDKGISPSDVLDSVEIFKKVYENSNSNQSQNIGIGNIPALFPRIKLIDGEEVVTNLIWVTVDEIAEELSRREGAHLGVDTISIGYSLKDGIYSVGSLLRPCKVGKQKIKIIKLIHSGEAVRLKQITKKALVSNEANASRSIGEINEEFTEKLKLEYEFISHDPAVGYHLNTARYNIVGH